MQAQIKVTKAQQMARITAGLVHECFEHETHGMFDVTAMREAAKRGRYGDPVSIALLPQYAQNFMKFRDYELERIWQLLVDPKAPWDNDPALAVFDPSDETHIFIDGTHRILARWILKLPNFVCWHCPLRYAIRPNRRFMMLHEWGEQNYMEKERNRKRLR